MAVELEPLKASESSDQRGRNVTACADGVCASRDQAAGRIVLGVGALQEQLFFRGGAVQSFLRPVSHRSHIYFSQPFGMRQGMHVKWKQAGIKKATDE